MGKIIAVVNQKGGVGKTTVAMNVAGCIANTTKSKVLVADADPQGSASQWSASASDDKPFPASVIGMSNSGAKTHREIKKFVSDYDFIIVDCPPAVDTTSQQSILLVSDIALIPTIPNPIDLWASEGMSTLIDAVSILNSSLQARLVLNQVDRTRINKDVSEILQDFSIKPLKTSIRRRVFYRESSIYGTTVCELGRKAHNAYMEIKSLTKEIISILEK